MVERAAEVLDQGALDGQLLRGGRGESVAAGDVDGEDLSPGALLGEAGGPAYEGAALGAAGQADDDALPGLPGGADVVLAPVLAEVLVDPVGGPEQRQFAQGGEVAGAEVVGEGRVDLVGGVDVAVGHPAPQRLRAHVDQFDLVRPAHDLVGDGLPLAHARDRLDHVAERLQVLDVDGGDDVDAGREQFGDVLPALGVAGAGRVRVGELVHEGDRGAAGQDRVDVHLGEGGAPVFQGAARHLLQAAQHGLRARASVVLHERDHAVRAALHPAVALGEHRVGLADARRSAEVDA